MKTIKKSTIHVGKIYQATMDPVGMKTSDLVPLHLLFITCKIYKPLIHPWQINVDLNKTWETICALCYSRVRPGIKGPRSVSNRNTVIWRDIYIYSHAFSYVDISLFLPIAICLKIRHQKKKLQWFPTEINNLTSLTIFLLGEGGPNFIQCF